MQKIGACHTIMSTPNWVSKELFEKSLRRFFNEKNVEILHYTTTNAVPAGDNYTSDLFRTTLTYTIKNGQKETMSVIVKCCSEDGTVKGDLAKNLHLFEKEIEMFTVIFPKIYEILGNSETTLTAKCLYTSQNPHTVIVFEDLTKLGFQMINRQNGFELDHCIMVIEKMAHLHAASVVLYEKDPAMVIDYKEGLFADQPMIRNWLKIGFESLTKASATWPSCHKYSDKLKFLGDELIDRGIAATRRKLGGFNVLNHGDLWVNNMMFSYHPDGRLKDLRFIDFQLGIFSSPAIDLHYFLATSPKTSVRAEHLDIILDHYYAQLIATLAKLQYSLERVPTREQFRRDFNNRAFYGLLSSVTVLPLVKASSRKDASFDDMMKRDGEGSFRHHCYNNERYKKHMEQLLPYYDSFNVMD